MAIGAVSGGLCAALILSHPDAPTLPAACCLATVTGPLAATDLTTRRLPNPIVLNTLVAIATAVGAEAAARDDSTIAARALVGATASLIAYGSVALATNSLGGGDAKLAAVTGAVLAVRGWQALLLATLISFSAAALFTGIGAAWRRRTEIPFGPWLLSGTMFALIW